MNRSLDELILEARSRAMSAEEREQQRRSFAFGSGAMVNPRITRDSVARVAEELDRERRISS